MCNFCHQNTWHNEIANFEHVPKIMTLLVNRFDPFNARRKNNIPFILEKHIRLNSSHYSLIASIHHHSHGGCASSGHYTSTIYYPNVIYHCSDSHIQVDKYKELSDNVYVVLYARDEETNNNILV